MIRDLICPASLLGMILSLQSAYAQSPDAIEPGALAADAPNDAVPYEQTVPVSPAETAESVAPVPSAGSPSIGGGVEEIVVTAQKREQDINDVSIAISAFTGDDLKALGVTDTRELSSLVPGFTYADSGFNTPVYTLRGIGFNEASQTASSTVGIYIDEFNLPFPVMSKGANLDLRRVEVLKGPQGTLYGRNTTGGAVNYVAHRPAEAFETGINASYGSYQTLDVEAFASGPVGDTVGARFAARTTNSGEGWQESVTRRGDHLGKKSKQAARLSVDWDVVESLSMRFTVDGWRDESEPQAPQAVYIRAQNPVLGEAALHPDVRDAPLVPPDTNDAAAADWTTGLDYQLHDRFLMGTARADWAFTDSTTLSALASAARFRSNGSTLPQSGLAVQYVTDRVIDVDTDAQSLELRLGSDSSERFTWLTGLFLSTDKVSEVQDYYAGKVSAVFPLPGELGTPIADRLILLGDQDADTRAVFANAEWQLQAPFKLSLGARYTEEMRSFTGCSADSPERTSGAGFVPVFQVIGLGSLDSPEELVAYLGTLDPNAESDAQGCFTTDVDTGASALARPDPLEEENVSGRVALDWKAADFSLIYASYSRGFKSGSFPVLSSSRSDQYEPVTQEQLDAYEIGSKNTLLDGLIQANGAVFYYDYKDKQLLSNVNDPFFGPLPVLRNAPKSRVIGVELELQSNPLEGLFASVSASYLDAEIEEFTGVNNEGDTVDYKGERFNFTPEWSGTVLLNYVRPVSEWWRLILGADYNYTGQTNAQLGGDPRFRQPQYTLINARVGLGSIDERWTLTLFGRNLGDEYYVLGSFNPGDTISRYTGMPRTIGLTLNYSVF